MKITKKKVVKGLKFIAEHQNLPTEEMNEGLREVGIDFTWSDFERQFPFKRKLFKGLQRGSLQSGACIILNVMDGGMGRSYALEMFFSVDDETSAYHYIRKVTRDSTYTMQAIA